MSGVSENKDQSLKKADLNTNNLGRRLIKQAKLILEEKINSNKNKKIKNR